MKNKMQTLLQNKKWQLFLIFWIVNVSLSIAYKFYYFHTGLHLQYTWLPDMFFFLLLIAAISPKKNGLALIGMFFLLLFKVIGSWTIAPHYPNDIDLFKDVVKTWMGYIYIFPLFLFLSNVAEKKPIIIPEYIKHGFVILAGGLALSVFIGLLFKAHIFHTYPRPTRFGISGLLYPSSYVSFFYIFSISSAYLLHKRMPSRKVYSILLYTLSLAAIFSGTKSTYLFLLMFYTLFIIEKKYYQKKRIWLLLSALALLLLALRHKLASVFYVLLELYQKEDFITFALSYRNVYAQDTWLFVQENWTWVNYLFGGLDNVNQLTEMAFIDLFLNFGALGSGLFLYLYYRLITRHLSWPTLSLVMAASIILLIAMGGNFFDRIYLAYWLVFLFLLQVKNND